MKNAFLLLLFFCSVVDVRIFSQNINSIFNSSDYLDNQYGLCAHINRPSVDWSVRDRDVQLINKIRVGWVRADLDWALTRKDGKFYHSYLDSMMLSVEKGGVDLLSILYHKTTVWPWQDTTMYFDYVREMARHYHGRMHNWEVINEVDIIKDENKIDGYVEVLKESFKILKAEDSTNNVLLSGIAEINKSYLGEIAKRNALDYCDIVNFHTYDPPEYIPHLCKRIRNVMESVNVYHPVWLTETGMHTAADKPDVQYLLRDFLPHALKKINYDISSICIAIIKDLNHPYSSVTDYECNDILKTSCKDVRSVKLGEIKSLNPKKIPVLIVSTTESFPMRYYDSVVEYVKKGGTIVCTHGLPFYFDIEDDGRKQIGMSRLADLHISAETYWTTKGIPEIPTKLYSVGDFEYKPNWLYNKSSSARFLTSANLKEGDEYVSLINAGNDIFDGSVAGIYKLNSDLKGNVIISTRLDNDRYVVREEEQARRLARYFIISYACGIDRVFWYNLRALEYDKSYSEHNFGLIHNDFSPKKGLSAYAALIKFLPSGSSRPKIVTQGDLYIGSWENVDGVSVYAVWTPGYDREVELNRFCDVYDYVGTPIELKSNKIIVDSSVKYILGNSISVDSFRQLK